MASDNRGPVGKCAAELWLSGYGLRVITVISPSLKFSTRELFDLYKTRMQAQHVEKPMVKMGKHRRHLVSYTLIK